MSRRGWLWATATAVGVLPLAALPATAAHTTGDQPVSVDSPYVKANGRPVTTNDAISRCGTNLRQQDEPTSAVDPTRPRIVTSGSNDYCTVELAGGTWTGFYRSTNHGQTWKDSLLPGYPTDTSPEGLASPLHRLGITNAGDPVQAWDLHGRLFYMGNAFNRAQPQHGSVWVATYDRHASHGTVALSHRGWRAQQILLPVASRRVSNGAIMPSKPLPRDALGDVECRWAARFAARRSRDRLMQQCHPETTLRGNSQRRHPTTQQPP